MPVAVAVVCVLALALAAGTFDSATEAGGGGGVGFGGSDGVGGSDDGVGVGDRERSPDPGLLGGDRSSGGGACTEDGTAASAFGVVSVVGLGVLGYVVARRHDRMAALSLVGAALPFVLVVFLLLTPCDAGQVDLTNPLAGQPPTGGGDSPGSGSGGGVGGGSDTGTAVRPPTALYGAVALGLVLVVGALLRGRESAPATRDAGEEADDPSAEALAVGRAAGRAAEQIESGTDAENDVYRAWAEMTDSLSVDRPASSTPAEFASAAVEAGLDREDVEELTVLFEAVRYGGRAVTDERERRAVAALRRIQQRHGEGGRE